MPRAVELRGECVIALDVGGTSVKSGIVARGGRVRRVRVDALESDAQSNVILEAFAGAIAQHETAVELARLRGIAIGFPGPFDYTEGVSAITGLSKFANLYGVNVKKELGARFHLPILMRNDAEAAIVGEARYGAGQAYRRVMGVTLGTGLGSCFLVDGEPTGGGRGVPPDGWLYPLTFRGARADDVFSIRGLKARAAHANIQFDDPKQLARRARRGNLAARQVFEQFGAELGEFLQPFAAEFQTEVVLILGGLAGTFDLLRGGLGKTLSIPALAGRLGTRAALLGAAELFFH